MEQQNTLTGQPESNNNHTNMVVLRLQHKYLNSHNMQTILRSFYLDFTERGLSISHFTERFFIHENSVIRALKTLQTAKLITLVAVVGETKRKKYYKITEGGAKFYETNKV